MLYGIPITGDLEKSNSRNHQSVQCDCQAVRSIGHDYEAVRFASLVIPPSAA